MACLECGLEQAVADAGTCPRCGAPLPAANNPPETSTNWGRARLRVDSRGITVGRGRHLIPWEEIGWFRDGVRDGCWVLHIVLANGRKKSVPGTWAADGQPVPPELLAAIRSTAAAHSIPAVLTGRLISADLPGRSAGLYFDPAGEPGLREWTGTEWSPFLQVDPVASGQPGQEGELARIWSPLSAAELHRQSRAVLQDAKDFKVGLAVFVVIPPLIWMLVVAIGALRHHGTFGTHDVRVTGAVCVICLALWGLVAWLYGRSREKVAQALTAAAIQVSAEDDPPG
jgi:hypothetical protein